MIFPEYEVKISDDVLIERRERGKTLDFDFVTGDFVLKDGRAVPLTGADAVKIRIEKCLRTILNKYEIYRQDSEPYGITAFDLTNRQYPFAFLCAEVEREVTEALLRDSEILAVTEFTFERDRRTLETSFTVESIYGEQEVQYQWLTV